MTYDVTLVIAQYTQRYAGEYAPNVVDAWDEYVIADNNEGFNESLAKHEARVGKDYEWVRTLVVTIPQDVVFSLADPPTVRTTWKQAPATQVEL